MIRRAFVLSCCVLLGAVPSFGQSRTTSTAKADAITGTWSGELSIKTRDNPVSVTMELKFDGKSAVTGTFKGLPNPGDVKKGTFDPKSGTLKLELGRADGAAVLIVLEGKVVKGTATGRLSGEPGDGEFKLTKKG
jgi:hypothetical protein